MEPALLVGARPTDLVFQAGIDQFEIEYDGPVGRSGSRATEAN
jgi:hypothetical protein